MKVREDRFYFNLMSFNEFMKVIESSELANYVPQSTLKIFFVKLCDTFPDGINKERFFKMLPSGKEFYDYFDFIIKEIDDVTDKN